MANAQGGQGQPKGQGGHGQTFTSAQHDAALGRESTGPGTRHDGDAPRVMDGAEATIQPPEGGLGDADSAPQSDMEGGEETPPGAGPA